jgi:hypothetical protein
MRQRPNEEVVIVDIRDLPQSGHDGEIPGAMGAWRGILELIAEPQGSFHESPYHKGVFATGEKLFLFRASDGRSEPQFP